MGRKQKPYQTTWGEVVPGLAHDTDGKWRVLATGQKYRDADERRAVAKGKAMIGDAARGKETVEVGKYAPPAPSRPATVDPTDPSRLIAAPNRPSGPTEPEWHVSQGVAGSLMWPWLREQLLTRPEWVAERVGIPHLATLASFQLPRPPVRLSLLAGAYTAHSTADDLAKRQALAAWSDLLAFTGATTTDDLTDGKLADYRAAVLARPTVTSSGTATAYFSRCRSVVKLAGRGALDAEPLAALLARMRSKLYAPPNNVSDDPRPVSRDDLHKLLRHAGDGPWRAWLLLAVNAALYAEDVCDLQWDAMDLDAGTFVGRRKKRGTCIRAATLFPETVAALGALPRSGSPFVFPSSHGTRYNRNTRINDFREFADAAGCPGVTFSHLRDGAYTAATHGAPDERWARLLAGHKAPGLADKYVLRNPECVRPACDAVYAAYGPF